MSVYCVQWMASTDPCWCVYCGRRTRDVGSYSYTRKLGTPSQSQSQSQCYAQVRARTYLCTCKTCRGSKCHQTLNPPSPPHHHPRTLTWIGHSRSLFCAGRLLICDWTTDKARRWHWHDADREPMLELVASFSRQCNHMSFHYLSLLCLWAHERRTFALGT